MSDRIEQFTDIILACLRGAPNARAGARLAAYRLADETRKALMSDAAIDAMCDRGMGMIDDIGVTVYGTSSDVVNKRNVLISIARLIGSVGLHDTGGDAADE